MNEIISQFIDKNCILTVSGYASEPKGKITAVKDNWVTVETKYGNQLINLDYVISIKETKK